MKWFVGLGNPGAKYELNRHNAGFLVVDQFASKWDLSWKTSKWKADIAEGSVNGEKVILVKPLTFMNLSGEAVRALMDYYKLALHDLIVIYDDLDTEFGKLRIRYKGSAGGHNGMKSMIQHLSTNEFKRIRFGISRPPAGQPIVPYVLSDFAHGQTKQLEEMMEIAIEAMESMLQEPFDQVMAHFNG